MTNSYGCINDSKKLVKGIEIATAITNCNRYSAKDKCSLCSTGNFLKNDETACLATGCGTNGAA